VASSSKATAAQAAIEDLRAELRAAGARRVAAQAELDNAAAAIADLAISAKGLIPVEEIAKLGGYKSRKTVYDLIDWRSGKKSGRH
jgi:hypothetical protein